MKKPGLRSTVGSVLAGCAVTCASWGYGGTEGWALAATALPALGAVIVFTTAPSAVRRPRWWTIVGLLPAVLLFAYVVIQALNASYTYDPRTAGLTPQPHTEWLPRTVHAGATWNLLMQWGTAFLVFLAARCCVHGSVQRTVLTIVSAGGFVMALLVCMQRTGSESYEGLTGMFVNENHYAAWANLVLCAMLGLGRAYQEEARSSHGGSHPGFLYYFAAGIVALSVALSESRAGIVVCAALFVAWLLSECLRLAREDGYQRGRQVVTLLLPCVLAGGLAASLAAPGLQREFGKLRKSGEAFYEQRLIAYRGAWNMFLQHRTFGVGAGAFYAAFPYYQPDELRGYYRYAHNDGLQLLAELGVVGGVLVLGAVAAVLAPSAKPTRAPSAARRGLWLGLLGLGAHAMADFPLYIPGILCTAALYAGLLSAPPPAVATSARLGRS